MELNEIIKEQIRNAYPNSEIMDTGAIKLEINDTAKLFFTNKYEIRLVFNAPAKMNQKYLEEFYTNRMAVKKCILYFKKDYISVYPRYKDIENGVDKFNQTMDIFSNFKSMLESYELMDRIVNDKLA